MVHDDCDWAIAGECDFCGHRTNPDNMLTCYKHSFCDEECMREWKAQEDKKKDIKEPLERRANGIAIAVDTVSRLVEKDCGYKGRQKVQAWGFDSDGRIVFWNNCRNRRGEHYTIQQLIEMVGKTFPAIIEEQCDNVLWNDGYFVFAKKKKENHNTPLTRYPKI